MKKTLKLLSITSLASLVLLMSSCASKPLYSWYDYQEDYYNYIKKADEKSLNDLINTYEKIINNQNGTRGVVPPGIYADYGYILLEQGKTEEAKAMFAKELELYPESEIFVGSILKRINK